MATDCRIPHNHITMKTNLHTNPIPGFTSVNAQERKELGIRSGDTVRVHQKIKEKAKGGKGGEKTRIQVFEGLVLATKHGAEPGATFTVRKVSNGVGIERIFPLYSPVIDKIEIVKRAKVRRSKLYHIREKVAKEIKRQMRKSSAFGSATMSDAEYQEQKAADMAAAEEAAAQAAEAAEAAVAAEATGEEVPAEEQATDTPAETTEESTEAPAEEEQESNPSDDQEEEKKD